MNCQIILLCRQDRLRCLAITIFSLQFTTSPLVVAEYVGGKVLAWDIITQELRKKKTPSLCSKPKIKDSSKSHKSSKILPRNDTTAHTALAKARHTVPLSFKGTRKTILHIPKRRRELEKSWLTTIMTTIICPTPHQISCSLFFQAKYTHHFPLESIQKSWHQTQSSGSLGDVQKSLHQRLI